MYFNLILLGLNVKFFNSRCSKIAYCVYHKPFKFPWNCFCYPETIRYSYMKGVWIDLNKIIRLYNFWVIVRSFHLHVWWGLYCNAAVPLWATWLRGNTKSRILNCYKGQSGWDKIFYKSRYLFCLVNKTVLLCATSAEFY